MPIPKQVQPYQPDPVDPVSYTVDSMDGGIVTDLSPVNAPGESAASMDAVRFQAGGIRKDFGWAPLGTAAATKVLAYGEHRYVAKGTIRSRLVRLSRTAGGLLLLEKWDGAVWVQVVAPAHPIQDVYLSVISVQDVLVIADGKFIYGWQEEAILTHHEHNFAEGNVISSGDTSDVAVVPAGAVDNYYAIHFSINWVIPVIDARVEIHLAARINAVVVERQVIERTFVDEVATFTEDFTLDLIHAVVSGDVLDLLIESVVLPTINKFISGFLFFEDIPSSFPFPAPPDMYQLVKESAFGTGVSVDYTYRFQVALGTSTTVTIELWISLGVLGEDDDLPHRIMISMGTFVYNSSGVKEETIPLSAPANSVFGISLKEVDPPLSSGGITNIDVAGIKWQETPAFTLRPWNKTVDPKAGVEYDVDTGNDSQSLEVLALDAPNARFVAEFEDRLIALHDVGDPQAFSASADGDIKKWAGLDTQRTSLTSSRSDSVDDLMGLAPLGNAVGALFRKRSIMRTFETGNVDFPVGIVKWLDHIGTESPFSIQLVDRGIMFLGHDMLVYFLSEQGAIPVSSFIQDELLRTVPTTSLGIVDSAYDSVFNVYMLGVPTIASPTIVAEVWMFELGAWLLDQKPRWRRRVVNVERMIAVSLLA